jgi:putative membrane protein
MNYLLFGIGAGLLADLVVAGTDRGLSRFVTADQRLRERAVREGSAHQTAGKRLARLVGGGRRAERIGQLGFTLLYGVMWGVIYALVRRRVPAVARYGGLPFAVPFFLFCDGVMAPLLKLSPSIRRVPWQPNAKELLNHVAWTTTAELAHRAAAR